jgi:hypothetical protein
MMQIEKISYAGNPERITEEVFDCIWVCFLSRKSPSPLSSQVLQWMDWKMQGALSRYLLSEPFKKTTFIPTSKRLRSPLIALEPVGEMDWKSFATNCTGMKLGKVLVLAEGGLANLDGEKELRKVPLPEMEQVVLGTDGPVGRG